MRVGLCECGRVNLNIEVYWWCFCSLWLFIPWKSRLLTLYLYLILCLSITLSCPVGVTGLILPIPEDGDKLLLFWNERIHFQSKKKQKKNIMPSVVIFLWPTVNEWYLMRFTVQTTASDVCPLMRYSSCRLRLNSSHFFFLKHFLVKATVMVLCTAQPDSLSSLNHDATLKSGF